MNRYRRFAQIAYLAALLLLSGCAGRTVDAGPEILPPPTEPRVAVAPGSPVVTPSLAGPPSATPTPFPTATALPPSPAPTQTPSPTPSVTPSPSLTPLPTSTPLLPADLTATARPTAWPTPDHPLTWDERALLFDELWKLINERYLDPNFNGVDWAAEGAYRRERALSASGDAAYYNELREMVWTLDDEHSRFMDPHEAVDHFALSRNEVTYGGLGLYTMPLPDGALVLQVIPGSPAARAGVQACDRITSFNGGGYWNDQGAVGTRATVDFFRPGSGAYTLTLTREEVNQVLDVPGEVLPGRDSRIGYVRLDTLWVMDFPARLRSRLAELEAGGPLDGLILDLRSNVGGWRPVLQGILGTFTQGTLGEFSGRLESEPLVAPREGEPPPAYPDLPLVVLVSERTESYAEVLAATLQAERGAIVLGQPTYGNVETIFPRRLPFGARVWIAEQGFQLNNGETLEGVGVQPDVVDHTDWARYACGRDPQVEMAAILLENW